MRLEKENEGIHQIPIKIMEHCFFTFTVEAFKLVFLFHENKHTHMSKTWIFWLPNRPMLCTYNGQLAIYHSSNPSSQYRQIFHMIGGYIVVSIDEQGRWETSKIRSVYVMFEIFLKFSLKKMVLKTTFNDFENKILFINYIWKINFSFYSYYTHI